MTDAERLRERVVRAVVEPYPESVFLPVPDDLYAEVHGFLQERDRSIDALSADTIRRCLAHSETARRVLLAIVDELGITESSVEDCDCGQGYALGRCHPCGRRINILRTLREAAGSTEEGET